jgi:predicted O-methyltransferase YrrM
MSAGQVSGPARWAEVDRYVTAQLIGEDPTLAGVLGASEAAGLTSGAICASLGKLLELLVRISGARRVLELGTLGGYSTAWLARALPAGGSVVTLEADPHHAAAARANIAGAGFSVRTEVRVGPALETMEELVEERVAPFDLIFLDADKRNNPGYLEGSLLLARRGTVIVADNVVRAGAILDPGARDPRLGDGGLEGLRRFYGMLADEPRVSATAIQTVDGKGHDGFVLALVTGDRP